jgi:hypothetical protein
LTLDEDVAASLAEPCRIRTRIPTREAGLRPIQVVDGEGCIGRQRASKPVRAALYNLDPGGEKISHRRTSRPRPGSSPTPARPCSTSASSSAGDLRPRSSPGFERSYTGLPDRWRRLAQIFDLVNLAGLLARGSGTRRVRDVRDRIQATLAAP